MYFPVQSVNTVFLKTCDANYPLYVKIERLRTLHQVCDNLKDSIRSHKRWTELEIVSDKIINKIDEYQKLLPEGVITYH